MASTSDCSCFSSITQPAIKEHATHRHKSEGTGAIGSGLTDKIKTDKNSKDTSNTADTTADTTDRTLVHIHVLYLQVNSGKAGMADTDEPIQQLLKSSIEDLTDTTV